ncbi:unnamed protein product [Mytilus edulis]|uniref:Uncharacterized protein n=1 Tax=Mytilus edulis TaxID=6550 RepID=A0A8S3R342_MYTED|nr:unnamed protein product [Mytilus edulis]
MVAPLEDEKAPFQPVCPATNLSKSVTQIAVKGKKLVTITLYYTTYNCLVQGQVTQKWVETEFKLISDKVQEMMKKGGGEPDQLINTMPLESPLNVDTQVYKTDQKVSNDFKEKSNLVVIRKEGENNDKLSTDSDLDTEQKETEIEQEGMNESLPDKDIIEVLHTIESDHISQTVSLKNDVQSVQIGNNQILEITKQFDTKLESLEKRFLNQLISLSEKIEHNIDKNNVNSTNHICETDHDDCGKFIETLIELTTKISGLESKFEKFDFENKAKQDIEDETEPNIQVNVDLHNKFSILENEPEESEPGNSHVSYISKKTLTNNENESSKTEESKKNEICDVNDKYITTDLWIIGSSVTKHINPKVMYKDKKVIVATLKDKTVGGAKKHIENEGIKATVTLFQIGSNDLNKKVPSEVLQEVEDLVYTYQKCIPTTKIVLCELLPRFQRNTIWRKMYEKRRAEFNLGLKEISDHYNCSFVTCPHLREDDIIDGIHPSIETGVPKLVRAYKTVLNKMMGLKEYFDNWPNKATNQNYQNRNKHVNKQRYNTDRYGEPYMYTREQRNNYNYGKNEQQNSYMYSQSGPSNQNHNEYWHDKNNMQESFHHKDENTQEKLKWVLTTLMKELYN